MAPSQEQRQEGILLGYEVGTGHPVHLERHHVLVCGMTGKAGKTTAIEGFLSRWPGTTKIIFATKRGETGSGIFADARRIRPFFKSPTGEGLWRYLESMIEVTLEGEKQRQLRPVMIKVCEGAKSLDDVWQNVQKRLKKYGDRETWEKSQLVLLNEYLRMVLPELKRYNMADTLEAQPLGMNIMDLSAFSTNLQSMIIGAVAEHVNSHGHNIILVIPEAWEHIPNGKASPAKGALQALAKKGRVLGNFLVIDSQTIADVDPAIRKQCDNYILGKQPDDIESKRTLDLLPLPPGAKPAAYEVQTLTLGLFYAVIDGKVCKVYARPMWLDEETAVNIAKNPERVREVKMPVMPAPEVQVRLTEESRQAYEALQVPADEDGQHAQAKDAEKCSICGSIVSKTEAEKWYNATASPLQCQGCAQYQQGAPAEDCPPHCVAAVEAKRGGNISVLELVEAGPFEDLVIKTNGMSFDEKCAYAKDTDARYAPLFALKDLLEGFVKAYVDKYAPAAVQQSAAKVQVDLEDDAQVVLHMEKGDVKHYSEKTTTGKLLALIRMRFFADNAKSKAEMHAEMLRHYKVDSTASRFYKESLNDALDEVCRRPLSLLRQVGENAWALTDKGRVFMESSEVIEE